MPPDEGPRTRGVGQEERADAATEIACVLPNVMFETWFAAAADSLRGKNGLPNESAQAR